MPDTEQVTNPYKGPNAVLDTIKAHARQKGWLAAEMDLNAEDIVKAVFQPGSVQKDVSSWLRKNINRIRACINLLLLSKTPPVGGESLKSLLDQFEKKDHVQQREIEVQEQATDCLEHGDPFEGTDTINISPGDGRLLRQEARRLMAERTGLESQVDQEMLSAGLSSQVNISIVDDDDDHSGVIILQEFRNQTGMDFGELDEALKSSFDQFFIDINKITNTDRQKEKIPSVLNIIRAVNRYIPEAFDEKEAISMGYRNVLARGITALLEVSIMRGIADEKSRSVYATPFCTPDTLEKYFLCFLLELKRGKALNAEKTYECSLIDELQDVLDAESPDPVIHERISTTEGDIKSINVSDHFEFDEFSIRREDIKNLLQAYNFEIDEEKNDLIELLFIFLEERLNASRKVWRTKKVDFSKLDEPTLAKYLVFALHEGVMTDEQKQEEYNAELILYLIRETVKRKRVEKGPQRKHVANATIRRINIAINEERNKEMPGQVLDQAESLKKTLVITPGVAKKILLDTDGSFKTRVPREDLQPYENAICSGKIDTVIQLVKIPDSDIIHSGHATYNIGTDGALQLLDFNQTEHIIVQRGKEEVQIVAMRSLDEIKREVYGMRNVISARQRKVHQWFIQLEKRRDSNNPLILQALRILNGNDENPGLTDHLKRTNAAIKEAAGGIKELRQWRQHSGNYEDPMVKILVAFDEVQLAWGDLTDAGKAMEETMAKIDIPSTGTPEKKT